MIDYIEALNALHAQHAPWSYIVDVFGAMVVIGSAEVARRVYRR